MGADAVHALADDEVVKGVKAEPSIGLRQPGGDHRVLGAGFGLAAAVSPLVCGCGRIGIPAVRLGFLVSPVDSLLARDAEGGESMPILRLRRDRSAPGTDPLDLANGVPPSARLHGVLLDEAAWRSPWGPARAGSIGLSLLIKRPTPREPRLG
jgi:hypothetical protein